MGWLMTLHRSRQATAMIEMALVLPILLFFALLLAQVTLLMSGRLFVQYAAFAAARSAIVQVPLDTTTTTSDQTQTMEAAGETANVWFGTPGSTKYDRVQRAAALALLPVAGRLAGSSNSGTATGLVQAIQTMYSDGGQAVPAWVTNGQLADRARYVLANTDVQLSALNGDASDSVLTFAPRQTIQVRVHHRLNLAIPYIRGLFATAKHTSATGQGMYSDTWAVCLLTNEGISLDFPPRPNLPRNP